jgi:hypothetical protein
MDYYRKYIKYKTKYINLKTEINLKSETSNTQINQIAGQLDKININNNKQNIKMRIYDNINNKYPTIEKTEIEVNAFGYTHSKIIGGCMF